MKKALFKANCKVFENFEFAKLQEMLLKKINYFYKTYIRHLKRNYGINNNYEIFDVIKKDVLEFRQKVNRFTLNSNNLEEKEYDDMDLKNSLIIELFRNLNGRNPFLKNNIEGGNMENFLDINDENEKDCGFNEDAFDNKVNNFTDPFLQDYLSFNDLNLKDKVEILYFFCK